MAQKAKKIPKSMKFEDALAELESIVKTLESGEQSLEMSLEQFERGVTLSLSLIHISEPTRPY